MRVGDFTHGGFISLSSGQYRGPVGCRTAFWA
uniref:Uncharacterized protein n=1 Tax=Anguilla anguilla TaxID=7936 RepID=A0A0E9U0Q3_ANGAN